MRHWLCDSMLNHRGDPPPVLLLNCTIIKSRGLSPEEEQASTVQSPQRHVLMLKMATSAQLHAMCYSFCGKLWLKAADIIMAMLS